MFKKKLQRMALPLILIAVLSLIPAKALAAPMQEDWSQCDRVGYGYRESGPYVFAVQMMLYSNGYGSIVNGIDGYYGYNTNVGIRYFQDFVGLESDGIVGPNTWTAFQGFRRHITVGDAPDYSLYEYFESNSAGYVIAPKTYYDVFNYKTRWYVRTDNPANTNKYLVQ